MADDRDIDDLPKLEANYTALTPLWFLERAARVYPEKTSVIQGRRRFTWAETYARCRRMASALSGLGIGSGSTVAVLAPNVPVAYEAHFGVPMAGAVLNAVNIRLDARTVGFLLSHSRVAAVFVDADFVELLNNALARFPESNPRPLVVVAADEKRGAGGAMDYEQFLARGDPAFAWKPPADEWKSIALGYTSGTTSDPKGVVLSHRGAYVGTIGSTLAWDLSPESVYLWTLPMFHCNGWCYTWGMAAVAGVNVCLRQVTAKAIFDAIAEHGVTHFCAAPVVLNTIINSSPSDRRPIPRGVHVMTAGATPPASVLQAMESLGFRVTHTYGLSETYGPSTVCAWKPEWDPLPLEERAHLKARQGVRYLSLEGLEVVDPATMKPVPADGTTIGEIVMRGNMVMKGYLRNPKTNAETFRGGWFHSGDLGIKHPDGYIQIKDRSKDIIISGGENISSLEVENALYTHPWVLEASVVARADEHWGESPCAFVTLKRNPHAPGSSRDQVETEIIKYCRARLPRYMVPRSVVVVESLPKTATGKIQKHVLREKVKKMGPVRKSKL